MYRAETIDRGRRERLHRRLVAHVGTNRDRLHSARADALRGNVERALVDVGKHDVHPGRREAFRQRQPDPTRCTRDNRDLARFELHLDLPF